MRWAFFSRDFLNRDFYFYVGIFFLLSITMYRPGLSDPSHLWVSNDATRVVLLRKCSYSYTQYDFIPEVESEWAPEPWKMPSTVKGVWCSQQISFSPSRMWTVLFINEQSRLLIFELAFERQVSENFVSFLELWELYRLNTSPKLSTFGTIQLIPVIWSIN